MYPATFKGWLRLKVALATFFAGSISHPMVHVLGLSSEWYGQVPFLILSGGFVYLIIVGEWERVLYKRSEEHTSELQSLRHLVCRLLLEKKKKKTKRRRSWEGRSSRES